MKKMMLAALLVLAFSFPALAADKEKESVYDRVMRTGTIRCGYWNWEPVFFHDMKQGGFRGIFFDVMNELAKASDLKVEWTQEVRFADLVTDLEMEKIDAVCAGTWPSALRGKRLIFSDSVLYIPINAYVRADDRRFDRNMAAANAPAVKIAAMDGEMSSEIRNTDFPASTVVSIPQMAGSGTELLLQVETGKADMTFTDSVNGVEYMKGNPGKIRAGETVTPVRIMGNTIALKGDEVRLKLFFDTALEQLHNSGAVERILKTYDSAYPGALYRVNESYKNP